jgi:hypothetical protein
MCSPRSADRRAASKSPRKYCVHAKARDAPSNNAESFCSSASDLIRIAACIATVSLSVIQRITPLTYQRRVQDQWAVKRSTKGFQTLVDKSGFRRSEASHPFVDSESARQSIRAREDAYPVVQDHADLLGREVLLFLAWPRASATQLSSNPLTPL